MTERYIVPLSKKDLIRGSDEYSACSEFQMPGAEHLPTHRKTIVHEDGRAMTTIFCGPKRGYTPINNK